MELRNHTPGPAPGASARSATMGATRWTAQQWVGRVAIGSVLLAVVACGIGLLVAWPRWFSDPLEQGRRAYDRGDWNAAARSAREILSMRQGDPAALGLLARSSVQLGRDDAAIRIYNRLLEAKTVQAEDYLLLGVVLKRQGQEDGAMWAWVQALEAEPASAQTLAALAQLFHKVAVETETPESMMPHPLDAAARAAERLRRQPGWESRGEMTLGIIRGESLDPDRRRPRVPPCAGA